MTPRALSPIGFESIASAGAEANDIAVSRRARASFAQRRLWFFEQLQPGTAVLHLSRVLTLKGAIDVAAVERACEAIQSRHETLRTAFVESDGELFQVIAAAAHLPFDCVDLRDRPESSRAEAVAQATEECLRQPFDLARGPLWRARVIRLGDTDSRVVLCLHHLVSDGVSLTIFLREIGALYKATCDGTPHSLPPLAWQYRDFADWQRQSNQDAAMNAGLAYWVERMQDAPAVLDLPADHSHPANQSFRGGSLNTRLDKDLAWRLERLGRARGASLFMVLLAGFSALLSRLSGQTDLVVGAPVAGRIRPDLEPMIGLFINTLPLRIDLSGNPTCRDLIDRAKTTSCDAFEHQTVPFEQIVAAVRPDRARSNTPLFQVLFNMQHAAGEAPTSIGGVTGQIESGFDLASKFDLTVYLTRRPEGVDLTLVYNADLFDQARVAETARQYQGVLAQFAASPETALAALDLRTHDAALLLPDPSAPQTGVAIESIVARLREQARTNPDRTAIVSPDSRWTYRDLNRRTDVLAARLRELGIAHGDVVAIHAHRSAPLVLSLLGVMKAGAAFCILDPGQPAARLADCVRAAQPAALLHMTRSGAIAAPLQEAIAALGCRTIEIDEDHGLADDPGTAVPGDTLLDPDRLTYIAFTSGTTGGVKAIAGTERPLTHFLDWHTRTFGLTQDDRCCALSGLAHDPLLRDLLTPLWIGGRLEMPPDVDLRDADAIARWLVEREISIAHLTPPMARLLSDAAQRASFSFRSLRHVFFAGDTLTRTVVDGIRAVAPNAECVNFYGATETPQAMGFWRVPSPAPDAMPLGTGIDGVQLLVLTGDGRIAGIGEPGEIGIRTPYLTQGYRGDPQLTRDRFIRNPFTTDPDDRVYRTGDLGRYRPDGAVEFVCRQDTQVKIRGFRVELHEVEQTLLRHPTIADAVAVVRSGSNSERRIVVHCVPRPGQLVSARALRMFLEGLLPDYAIPAQFVSTARLPLTPNGKVDRAALASAEHKGSRPEQYVAPASGTERALARIWEDLLDVERVGVRDGFFERGGHSLLGMRVMARVREQLAVDLPLRTLFEFPTVAALGAIIDRQLAGTSTMVDAEEREEIEL